MKVGKQLWDYCTIGYVLEQLVGWGFGSGEELYEYVADRVGMEKAKVFMDILNEVAE